MSSIDKDSLGFLPVLRHLNELSVRGDSDATIAFCSRALAQGTSEKWDHVSMLLLLTSRSHAYLRKGDFRAAIADMTEYIRLSPDSASAAAGYSGRADGYSRLGEHEAAVADLTEAIRLAPADPQFYEARAAAYTGLAERLSRSGDPDAARYAALAKADSQRAANMAGWPPWKAPLIYLGFGVLFIAVGLLGTWLSGKDGRPLAMAAIGAVIALPCLIWLIVTLLSGLRKK